MALGAYVQSARDADKISDKNRNIASLEARATQAAANVEGAQAALAKMEANYRALKGKAEILERFLTYRKRPRERYSQAIICTARLCTLAASARIRYPHRTRPSRSVTGSVPFRLGT